MKISMYKSIQEITKKEWENADLDFAISDGIYELAVHNEKYASFDMNYIKVESEGENHFFILYFVELIEDKRNDEWYFNFLINYFGGRIINELDRQAYKKICMVMLPRNKKPLDNFENIIEKYINKKMKQEKCLLVFSLFNKPENLAGYIHKQNPYMYFDLSKAKTFDEYMMKQKSKVRCVIRNDRKKLVDNQITLRKIRICDYISQILELNLKSTYPNPESLIKAIPYWENDGLCHTIGFFKAEKLVQFLVVMISGGVGYTIAGNIEKALNKWSGVMNDYNILIEQSIQRGAKRAYIGYECCEEKKHRGAIPLIKFLYVPSIKLNDN